MNEVNIRSGRLNLGGDEFGRTRNGLDVGESVLSHISESDSSNSGLKSRVLRAVSDGPWLEADEELRDDELESYSWNTFKPERFFRAATEPMEIILCLEFTRFRSMATAPSSNSRS